eukprot:11307304-Prorocentrum_lima.AAC.1
MAIARLLQPHSKIPGNVLQSHLIQNCSATSQLLKICGTTKDCPTNDILPLPKIPFLSGEGVTPKSTHVARM